MEIKNTIIYAGIDVHKNSWDVQCMSEHVVLKRFRITSPNCTKLLDTFKEIYPGMRYKCAYEAGFSGFSVQRELESLGVSTIVVHPADIPTTDWEKRHKSDQVDCYKIANGLRSKMIRGIHIPEEELTKDRSIVRYRYSIASDVRRTKNRITSHLYFFGISPQLEKESYWSKAYVNQLRQIAEQGSDFTLTIMLDQLCLQRDLLAKSMKELRKLAKTEKYKDNIELLQTIPGVGLLTIMVYLTEIGASKRFETDDQYFSYLGFVPSTKSSGETQITGGLTKRGNKRVRTALILSAWMAIRISPDLLSTYETYKTRGMPSNKAIIKIARKLALIMKAVLRDRKPYKKK